MQVECAIHQIIECPTDERRICGRRLSDHARVVQYALKRKVRRTRDAQRPRICQRALNRQRRAVDRRKASNILVTRAVDRNGSSADVRLNRPQVHNRDVCRAAKSRNIAHIAILATDCDSGTDRQRCARSADHQFVVNSALPEDHGSRPAHGLAANEIQVTVYVARHRPQRQRSIQCQPVLHRHAGVACHRKAAIDCHTVQRAAAPRHRAARRYIDRPANECVVEKKRTGGIHRQSREVRQRTANRYCRSIDRRKASGILMTRAVDGNGSSTDVCLNRPQVDHRDVVRVAKPKSRIVAHNAILATDCDSGTDRQRCTRGADPQVVITSALPEDHGSRSAQGLAADEIQVTIYVC